MNPDPIPTAPPPDFRIIADDRERPSGVVEVLEANGHTVIIQRLDAGDYLVNDRLIVERKTIKDFALSIIDGRLFRQCNALAYLDDAILILEGRGADLKECAIDRTAMQGALVTVALIYRIPVLRSLNPSETARLMIYAADQLTRSRSDALRRPGYRPKGLRKQKLFALQGFPGIGPRRAQNLLDRFGTIENVLSADEPSLCSVPGIGPDAAKQLRSVLREHADVPYAIPIPKSRGAISGKCADAHQDDELDL